jgi:hypothetical protein
LHQLGALCGSPLQQGENVMRTQVAIAVVALLAGALMLPNHETLARGGSGKAETKGWIDLHRPDGEVAYIKADQIVFVMSATATGADKRARAKIQLLNGFFDARESVEEVMQAIQDNDRPAKNGT